MYPPNFELLCSDASWRQTWTHIIPGGFSSSPYTGLLFFEESTGYAETQTFLSLALNSSAF
jgi:hypothetical protein